jgi:hypothetical protein
LVATGVRKKLSLVLLATTYALKTADYGDKLYDVASSFRFAFWK